MALPVVAGDEVVGADGGALDLGQDVGSRHVAREEQWSRILVDGCELAQGQDPATTRKDERAEEKAGQVGGSG